MKYECKVIADSSNRATGHRLTTMVLTYPRFIHSEVLTHRDRARNSASSRAIPWPVMMEQIVNDPVTPIRWGSEKKGMQTGGEVSEPLQVLAQAIWLKARDNAVKAANLLANIGETYYDLLHGDGPLDLEFFNNSDLTKLVHKLPDLDVRREPTPEDEELRKERIHKSLVNRITEPWMWITVVMTATKWENLFRLRVHPDAEVHFQKLAAMIQQSLRDSRPTPLNAGEWHLPFIQKDERNLDIEMLKKASVARCARVSYKTHEGERNMGKDLELFQRLCGGSGFGHWSPHEHVAQCARGPVRSGPFFGWIQYRKFFQNECADLQ